MTWNYRIINHGVYLALHEVYYNADRIPTHYTSNPVQFCVDPDDDDDAIAQMLEIALADARHYPVLDVKIFKLSPDQRPVAPRRKKE